jgi:hypothetical protein
VQGGEPLPTTRAKKAIVAHFDEAFGQDVLQEAADELLSGKGAGLKFAGVGGAVAEGHLPVGQLQDAVVADGHAKDVGGQILQGGPTGAHRWAKQWVLGKAAEPQMRTATTSLGVQGGSPAEGFGGRPPTFPFLFIRSVIS